MYENKPKKIINRWLQSQYTKIKLVSSEVLYMYGQNCWSEHLVQLHKQVDVVSFSFGFGLTVVIRGGWRVDLSWRRLRQKLAKKSCTSSSLPIASKWTDSTKDTPPTTDPPSGKEDDKAQRDYGIPIPSWKAIPDDYERDNNNDDITDETFAPRTLPTRPLLPTERQMIVTRRINTYPSLPERLLPMNMNATTTITKNTKILRQGHSTNAYPPAGEADDSAQRDYNLPIPSQKRFLTTMNVTTMTTTNNMTRLR